MNRFGCVLLAAGVLFSGAVFSGEETALVVIRDYSFNPPEITVRLGETIRWENREKRQYHSVWFEESGEPEPEYFFPDEFYEKTFDTAGTFPYRCGPHPEMRGVVHVTD